MVLERLELQNFRNYKKASFAFSPQISLLVGPNSSGKTNVLEAIFLLSLGRTFRPGLEREMIRFGEEVGRVRGEIRRKERIELEVVLTRGEVLGKPAPLKKLLVEGVVRRLAEFGGNLAVVLFGPEDLNLVGGPPLLRRNFLDFVLEQVDGEYRRRSLIYKKALLQRNKLLRLIAGGRREERELDYWDKILVENGDYLARKREEFFEFINNLPKNLGDFVFTYQKNEISFARLEKGRRREIERGMTLVGPQREEFVFEVGGRDLAVFGSRGEQRTAVLALKLAQLEFMAWSLGEEPILLLDDIFSELDKDNRREILRVIPKQQTIITTTDLEVVEKGFLEKIKIIDLGG